MKLSELNPYTFRKLCPQIHAHTVAEALRRLIVYPQADMTQRHLSVGSDFCRAVVNMGYLTQEQMNRAALRYRLGKSRDGGVIFWQIDQLGHVYDGKIMYYRPDCHRDHGHHPTWVSSELKQFYLSGSPKLAAELQFSHCLFGTYLIREKGGDVVVVESEKTAVIMSEIYSNYLWLAAGGMNELTATKLFPLKGRKIILMPDTDEHHQAYSNWYKVCQEAQRLLGHPIYLSPFLEYNATSSQKSRKIDILDYYIESHKIPL